MKIEELAVPDAYRIIPEKWPDIRGYFYEAARTENIGEAIGHRFEIAQVNFSVSHRNTLRGVHGVTIPPGQAKFVSCLRGAALDIVVDLRIDSPAFGRYSVNILDASSGVAVYIAAGLGHGFLALADDTCVGYLCSTTYVPEAAYEIDPLDPELDLPWGLTEPPITVNRSAAATSLASAIESGVLSTYQECKEYYENF
ncbi:dTDP-4-dehydrorhamnose 3,5-epimerase family protein [Nocardia sp. NPDC020380]|uniref:dTDP-4-dehydrorhamnose 3,5-epimerase family protein n=1 Tax=Nocardia sp. NPDC020380 TaxID=3364309 RepID=UPI0037A8852C